MSRRDMGRDAFVARVWEWKEQSGGSIVNQLKRLGASCDWSRERFTMDEGLSKAVTKVFVDLYNKGLIYRDKRLVTGDPHFQTAISDLEVDQREVNGHYWHLRYPLADGVTYEHPVKDEDGNVTGTETRNYIIVATSRPETMLGDTGVAVHPEDERYKGLVGKFVELPIVGRRVPIIADEYANPEKGSGAVKITPAHDFNDFQVGERAGLAKLNILSAVAAIVDGAEADAAGIPADYRGLDRFKAREKVIADFEAAELLDHIENVKIEQPFGDRSNVVIEPWMTDQWYVDAKTLAQPAIAAVREGKTKFVPENWEKTYYNWMENIQPWCVSRQLWWGHRIPAWFGPPSDDEGCRSKTSGPFRIFVAPTAEEAKAQAEEFYKCRVNLGPDNTVGYRADQPVGPGNRYTEVDLQHDEDVLDTWFSSALWPFSTQGWPDQTDDLKTFFPTATVVTAFDIIFFWVARMMMMSLEFMGEVPFRDAYIHALVLDEKGQKMSKSKGNAMDPLDLINEYGADALRFAMSRLAGQGRNIRLSKQVVEGNRNFATKLWNAARFAEMNECGAPACIDFPTVESPVNRWILSELSTCIADVTKGIEDFRFNDAAGALYKFIWNTFCDWYVELIKPLLGGMDDGAKSETRQVCGYVLDETLKLLHPFMPFVTEELWERRATGRTAEQGFLMMQQWPAFTGLHDKAASDEINWVIDLITEIRSLRNDLDIPAGTKVPFALVNAGDEIEARAMRHEDVLKRLARLEDIAITDATPAGAVTLVFGDTVTALVIADLVDIDAACKRLDKELAQLDKDITSTEKKLANADFVARAPEEIVEENRERVRDWTARREKLRAARKGLEGL
ncbi:MAG: valine--tRNA ligase [Hyphomonas sp.]